VIKITKTKKKIIKMSKEKGTLEYNIRVNGVLLRKKSGSVSHTRLWSKEGAQKYTKKLRKK